jgi:hypothetical protein
LKRPLGVLADQQIGFLLWKVRSKILIKIAFDASQSGETRISAVTTATCFGTRAWTRARRPPGRVVLTCHALQSQVTPSSNVKTVKAKANTEATAKVVHHRRGVNKLVRHDRGLHRGFSHSRHHGYGKTHRSSMHAT